MMVLAYESEDNFYPLNWEKCNLFVYYQGSSSTTHIGGATLDTNDNKYYFSNGNINNITSMIFQRETPGAFTFPYDPSLYDYYLLGTVVAPNGPADSQTTFKPTDVFITGYNVSSGSNISYPRSNLLVYNIDTSGVKGFGFSERVDFEQVGNIGIHSITMNKDKDGVGNKPASLTVEFGILAIDKTSTEEAALSQILSQLQSMESSINSSIGSAAGQISGSVSDAAGQISGSVSDAADQITGTIEDQYSMTDSEDFGVGQIADQVEEKLGVLTFGADTLHNFLDLFSAENVGGTQLTFPAFQIEVQGVSYNVWPDIIFDLSFLEEHFGVLITAVRTVTVLCVWLAVLAYLVKAKDHFINNKG